jgi:hypothetical protein
VLRDTLFQGANITYYIYTPAETGDTAYYNVSFSDVGSGMVITCRQQVP